MAHEIYFNYNTDNKSLQKGGKLKKSPYLLNPLQLFIFQDAFRVRQSLYDTITDENVTWSQACLKVPLVPTEYSDFLTVDEDPEDEKTTEDPFAAFGNDDDNGEKINFTEFFF